MFNGILKAEIPAASVCADYLTGVDYRDAFCARLADSARPIGEIYVALFAHSPGWINALMAVRNKLAGFLGLDDYNNAASITREGLKVGARSGLFLIYAIGENEIIAGEDDRHLNFRVSVYKQNDEVVISTMVKYNNRLGRLYMRLIRPFHKMVVMAMLHKAIKEKRI